MLIVGLLYLSQPALLRAQHASESTYGAQAHIAAPMASTNTEDATAAGTIIDLRERAAKLEEVADTLADVPGVTVKEVGGEGGFAGTALRGGELEHTAVLLGSIPLTTPDSGPFDFSLLPLTAFDQVEIYRGGAPAWYNEGAIGGVVRLSPAQATGSYAQATLLAGSFGLYELRGTAAYAPSSATAAKLYAHTRLRHADNDYVYIDKGTPLMPSAPIKRHQLNAEFSAGDLFLHGEVPALGGHASFVVLGHARDQGIPGPLSAPTRFVHRRLYRLLASAAYEQEGEDDNGERLYRFQLLVSGSYLVNQLQDPKAELGVSKQVDSNDLWQRAHARSGLSIRLLPFFEPTLVVSGAVDAYDPENKAAFIAPPRPSGRHTGSVTLEPRLFGHLFGMRAELRPNLRLVSTRTTVSTSDLDGVRTDSEHKTFHTLRLAAVLEPITQLTVASSVSTGLRQPSLTELFGDRVYRVGNPDLLAERSTSVDASIVFKGRLGALRGTLELRGFQSWITNLITDELTGANEVKSVNTGETTILGLESGLGLQYGHRFDLTSSLTALHTRSQFGKEVPFRPPLRFLVRPTLHFYYAGLDRVSTFFQVEHQSYAYMDRANDVPSPGRTMLDTGLSMSFCTRRLTVSGRLNNLLDQHPWDYQARQLPGRSFRVGLTITTDPPN